jgi:hypothetical protein
MFDGGLAMKPTSRSSCLSLSVLFVATVFTEAPLSALTIGTTDSGNCSLGGCLSGNFEYQQIYEASAFSRSITFDQFGFLDLPGPGTVNVQQPTPNARRFKLPAHRTLRVSEGVENLLG